MTPEQLESLLRDALIEHLAFSDTVESDQPSIIRADRGVVLRFADGTEYVVSISKSR